MSKESFTPNYLFPSNNDEDTVTTGDTGLQGVSGALYAPPNRVPIIQEKVITTFQSGHGFTKGSAGGTQSNDTSTFLFGTGCMRLTTGSDGSACFSTSGTISPTLDFTAKIPVIRLMVDHPENLVELWLYLSNDGMSSKWYTFKVTDDISMLNANEWAVIPFSFGKGTVTGGATRTGVNAVRVRATASNGNIVNVWFQEISYIAEPSAANLVFTFDDGYDDQYLQAAVKLSQYGFPAVAYIEPENVGVSGRMTLAQLQYLHNFNGWDISGHSSTVFDTISTAALDTLLQGIKTYLLTNALPKGANHVAYPEGHNNYSICQTARKYFSTGRGITMYAEMIPLLFPMHLRVFLVVNTTTTEAIATAVTEAITNKELLILVFHHIDASPAGSTEYSIANFATVVDNIATQGINVTTMSSLFG